MMSSGYSLPPARMPFGVISSIGPSVLASTSSHVLLVERLEIVGVQRLALGAVGVSLGRQLLRDHRVVDDRADLALEIVGDDVVRFLGEEHVLVVGQPEGEAAGVPHPVELLLALLGRCFEHRLRDEIQLEAEEEILDALADTVVIGLARLGHFGIDTAVARRHAEVGRTLEHRQVLGLLRDLRDRLHRRCARADDADALGGEVDAVVRPLARVVTLALERAQPLERRHVGGRQGSRRR